MVESNNPRPRWNSVSRRPTSLGSLIGKPPAAGAECYNLPFIRSAFSLYIMILARERLLGLAVLLAVPAAHATAGEPQTPQEQTASAPTAAVSAAVGELTYDGPPPPVPPAVITRDEQGDATVRAVRIDQPLRIDGRLDEEIYSAVPAAGGFIQQEPREGEPATEQTDAWVFFDDENLYVVGALLGRSAGAMGRQRAAPRQRTSSARTRTSSSCSTRSTTGATGSSSRRTRSAPCAIRRSPTRATATRTGTRSGT